MGNNALTAFDPTIPARPDESVRTGIPTFQLLLAHVFTKNWEYSQLDFMYPLQGKNVLLIWYPG
jgi:hypothetical protein